MTEAERREKYNAVFTATNTLNNANVPFILLATVDRDANIERNDEDLEEDDKLFLLYYLINDIRKNAIKRVDDAISDIYHSLTAGSPYAHNTYANYKIQHNKAEEDKS